MLGKEIRGNMDYPIKYYTCIRGEWSIAIVT